MLGLCAGPVHAERVLCRSYAAVALWLSLLLIFYSLVLDLSFYYTCKFAYLCVCRSEDSLQGWALSLQFVDFRDGAQVLRRGSRRLCLTGSVLPFQLGRSLFH